LSTDRWPEGYDRIVMDAVDSTNAEAARLAPHLSRPTWIMARRQTAARGRRGRPWAMPEGNFAATLVMRPGGHPTWAALRSFVAANALYATLDLYVRDAALALKWPNDVLLAGGKVAGILLESTGKAGTVDWLSIGIGVNLAAKPDIAGDPAFPPVCLADHGELVDPETFLCTLAGHFATQEAILERLGFDAVREDWLQRAAKLGEIITARTSKEEITGLFDTVDEGGNLVLITGAGRRVIPAADVYF
jgi:BirA family transcriptional regulator, biotin operon repressor / biotin---[acetyl-CoA-carboxylase] ligase